jgi:hypothetical protein
MTPKETSSWFGRAWEVVSDVLIATALMWTPPLLLGGAAALLRFLLQTR